MAKSKQEKIIELTARRLYWRTDPISFIEEVLNMKLPNHQKKMIKAISSHNKVSIRSANGIGKSRLLSALLTWFFFCFISNDPDENLIEAFTAPTFNQVKENIYYNFKDLVKRAVS